MDDRALKNRAAQKQEKWKRVLGTTFKGTTETGRVANPWRMVKPPQPKALNGKITYNKPTPNKAKFHLNSYEYEDDADY